MFVQSKFMSKNKKPTSQMSDQERSQQAVSTIMPIFLTVLFYKMPSGLNIYFLFSTIFGIIQQWVMNKTMMKKNIKMS